MFILQKENHNRLPTNELQEYDRAMIELQIAENQFNHAIEDFIEASIYKYNYALEKTKILRKRIKNKKNSLTI